MTNADNVDYVRGQDRDQLILFPGSIEEYIDDDNAVMVIDEFVDSLNLEELGFKHFESKELGGRPAYDPYDLLKLYLYGYLNGIRSSRKLARECKRNIELMWLLRKLAPDFRTISDFRKINIDSIKKVFRKFVELCKSLDLIGGELVGIDGVKLKAWNSKKRNFNKEKLEYRLKRLEVHIAEYLNELEEEEVSAPAVAPSSDDNTSASQAAQQQWQHQHAKEEIKKLESKKTEYKGLLERLMVTGQKEISLTDPECRTMKNNERLEPCYNAQVSVDSKFHLIPEYYVTNEPVDHSQLFTIAISTKEVLGVEKLDVTADKAYFNSQKLKTCLENGIAPYVPELGKDGISANPSGVPRPGFYRNKFHYDTEQDIYTCPAGQELIFRKWQTDRYGKKMKIYRTDSGVCSACKFKATCTKSHSRSIERWEHEAIIEELRRRLKTPKALKIMGKRKELAEHPFGTIKRAFNQGYLLLRSLRKVNGEVGFTMLAYNMRRAINVLGPKNLVMAMRKA
jgi:transposase